MKKINIAIVLAIMFFYNGCNSTKNEIANFVLTEISGNMQTQVVAYINQARSMARNCGSEGSFTAASEVSWDNNLASAAFNHSQDMSTNDYFDHTGSDGSTVGTRATEEGYTWSSIGENIFMGYDSSPKHVIESWMDSDGHCANIMKSTYEDIGLGVDGEYWTLVLGEK